MKRLLVGAASTLLVTLAGSAFAAETDRFYTDLLRDGVQRYDRGDFVVASRQLRVACFGMLDTPEQLAPCLVRLALAQAAAADADGFRASFRRVAEVQDRFGSYAKAAITPEVRQAFEQRALALMPPQILTSSPYFAQLVDRQAMTALAALPPRDRRARLDERIAKEPKNATLHVMLGELDLSEGHAPQAISQAQAALTIVPGDAGAVCLRGLAESSSHKCNEAIADLEPCGRVAQDASYAGGLLACRVELGRWIEADTQIRALPAGIRQDRRIAALIQQTTDHAKAATATPLKTGSAKPAATATVTERPLAVAAPQTPPAPTRPPTTGRSKSEQADLQRVRSLLDTTQPKEGQLREALRVAKTVADAHPEWADAQYLAAEAAYRNSDWAQAVAFFKRAGGPGDDQPDLLFYQSVSLYETGDRTGAEKSLRRALPRLQSSPYIDSYSKRILTEGRPN
jgi:tetratricopeptide (TPR) repeat protein